jgi:UDP-glucose 4-epimerase
MLSGEREIRLRGTGRESRDFLFVGDLAEATLGLIENVLTRSLSPPEVVNIASGRETPISEMAVLIKDIISDTESRIQFDGRETPGDPLNWCADISDLHRIVPEWSPSPLRDRLEWTIERWNSERKKKGAEAV